MALTKDYPAQFEAAWKAYPRRPIGRSVKQLSFKAWKAAAKREDWTPLDKDLLVLEIERQCRVRKSWQKGDRYGPQGMQVWLNQNGWDHDFPIVKGGMDKVTSQETVWQQRGMTHVEWEAEQDWLARESMKLPQKHASLEDALAAARRKGMH